MYKVLIVEDEENMVSFIQMELKYEGYEVDVADNGRLAVSMALENNYDIILLDLMLPGLNGEEIIKIIKDIPIFKGDDRDYIDKLVMI